MKRSIIHNNDRIFRKAWQKPLFKPVFKQWCICCSFVLHRCNYFVTEFCGNNICSLKFLSWNSLCHFFSTGSIRIFTIKTSIYTWFICISNLLWKNIFYFIQVLLYFFRILFFVACCLFFRVIPQRFKALLIAWLQHPNASAISFCVSSGCSLT